MARKANLCPAGIASRKVIVQLFGIAMIVPASSACFAIATLSFGWSTSATSASNRCMLSDLDSDAFIARSIRRLHHAPVCNRFFARQRRWLTSEQARHEFGDQLSVHHADAGIH